MSEDGTGTKEFKAPQFEDGLVLYFHPYNFYSQKVLLILYEKNIEFQHYVVDLSKGEQYSSWFLNLNPKGDVPVLQDGSFIIPNSANIISYVEGKFQEEKYKRLKPKNGTVKEKDKIKFYEQLFNSVPIGALSLGSFIHEDLKLNPKPPFIGPIRSSCLKNNEKVYEILKKSAAKAEGNSIALTRKLDFQAQRKQLVYLRVEFQKILDVVDSILCVIEAELKQHPEREWIISSEFCLVDISLGLLLHRLNQLGFENYYWANGKLPNIECYFLRFKKRDSYIKLIPTTFGILKDIWQKTPSNYKIGAGVLGMAMFAAFAHK